MTDSLARWENPSVVALSYYASPSKLPRRHRVMPPSDGVGFPDHTMLCPETGVIDTSVLERMIGMSRALRRIEQAKVKPGFRVMDFQKTSIGRLKLLLKDLFNVQQRLLKKSKRIDGYPSSAPVTNCQSGKYPKLISAR